ETNFIHFFSYPLPFIFFFFNDTPTTEIYTLSLHDALPICEGQRAGLGDIVAVARRGGAIHGAERRRHGLVVGGRERDGEGEQRRSEEHTSELQSRFDLVCRLLLEKKKKINIIHVQHMTKNV